MSDIVKTEETIWLPKECGAESAPINLSSPWFLEDSKYPRRDNNIITPYYSGEEIFRALAEAINKAENTIEITCWGFDPGMPIIRESWGSSKNNWKEEDTYGDHLLKAAERGVKIKLLLWYTAEGNAKMSNQIGLPAITSYMLELNRNKASREYSIDWYSTIYKKYTKNIQYVKRAISSEAIENEMKRTRGESTALTFPSDHQKSVLIDYEGNNPVGFVMGHNSHTGYWDTKSMAYREPKREGACIPWHDLSLKLEGECLEDLNHNFCESFIANGSKEQAKPLKNRLDNKIKPIQCRVGRFSKAQITRTRPDIGQEKDIKKAYFLATQNARRYILITNQYFQYPDWCRHLKECVKKYRDAGGNTPLHLFIITPEAENKGMVYRSFQAAHELGASDQFATAKDNLYYGSKPSEYTITKDIGHEVLTYTDPNYKEGEPIVHKHMDSENIQPTPTQMQEGLDNLEIKAHLYQLYSTYGSGAHFESEEVYIHAKLMVIDDAFFTLGSANLNMRSMSVDSELNISSDDYTLAHTWRQTMFEMYLDGESKNIQQPPRMTKCSPDMAEFFDKLKKLGDDNRADLDAKQSIKGHLVTLKDDRSINAAMMYTA